MLTFEPAKLQGETWGSGGLATPSRGPGSSAPSGGIGGGGGEGPL